MSKLSFITFCIECYSNYAGIPSSDVYRLFQREGVLELLETDYEDLHGMGMEYLMQFIDDYLGRNEQ